MPSKIAVLSRKGAPKAARGFKEIALKAVTADAAID
jgi:hypothetical protein